MSTREFMGILKTGTGSRTNRPALGRSPCRSVPARDTSIVTKVGLEPTPPLRGRDFESGTFAISVALEALGITGPLRIDRIDPLGLGFGVEGAGQNIARLVGLSKEMSYDETSDFLRLFDLLGNSSEDAAFLFQ